MSEAAYTIKKTKSIEDSRAGSNKAYFLSKRSGLWGILVKRFKFNWRSRLGEVTQKLNKKGIIRYPKEHTKKISAQSIQ